MNEDLLLTAMDNAALFRMSRVARAMGCVAACAAVIVVFAALGRLFA